MYSEGDTRLKVKSRKSVAHTMQGGIRVDNTNFAVFRWNPLHTVKIENCTKYISQELIGQSKELLQSVEFFGLTRFVNFENILKYCTSLKNLKFSHIIIEQFSAEAHQHELEAEKLTKLSIEGNGPLTIDEIHILDYFTHKVTSPRLRSLIFEDNVHRRPIMENETSRVIVSEGDFSILKFMAKNCGTLRCMTLERSPLIFKADPETQVILGSNLHLEEFTCNLTLFSTLPFASLGIEQILKNQRLLQVFATSLRGIRFIPPSNIDTFYEVVERSAETLKTIHVDNITALRVLDFEQNNDTPVVPHDFKTYEKCHQLEYLYVGVSIYHRLSLYRLVPGALTNVQYIPWNLKTLFLVFDIFEEEQQSLFLRTLPELQKLRSFSSKGNRETPYSVNIAWIQVLVQLPALRYFLLTGCAVEDFDNVREYVRASPELTDTLEVTPDCCAYTSWRNS